MLRDERIKALGIGMNSSVVDYLYGVNCGLNRLLQTDRKLARNWHMVALLYLGLVTSFDLELRSGEKIKIEKYEDYFRTLERIGIREAIKAARHNDKLKISKGSVAFLYKGETVRFRYDNETQLASALGQIGEQFFGNEYGMLDVKDRVVVDVGANIGDTAIYFALNEAKHVYAFEPFPYACRLAKRNIKENGLEDRITLIDAACGSCGQSNSHVRLDAHAESNLGSQIRPSKTGKRIRILSLDEVAEKYCKDEAVLKLDCEGAEYPLILNAQVKTLRKFKQMMIEYHDGYKNLEARLREAGFSVKHGRPKTISHLYQLLGLLYASRTDAE